MHCDWLQFPVVQSSVQSVPPTQLTPWQPFLQSMVHCQPSGQVSSVPDAHGLVASHVRLHCFTPGMQVVVKPPAVQAVQSLEASGPESVGTLPLDEVEDASPPTAPLVPLVPLVPVGVDVGPSPPSLT